MSYMVLFLALKSFARIAVLQFYSSTALQLYLCRHCSSNKRAFNEIALALTLVYQTRRTRHISVSGKTTVLKAYLIINIISSSFGSVPTVE